jgi:hypothetical protein
MRYFIIFAQRYVSSPPLDQGIIMANTKELQNGLAKVKKHLSLRQVAIQSGMNYITLRNIATGKTQQVTDKVAAQLKKFVSAFDPATSKPVLKKRGRKPGVKAATIVSAKPKAAAPKTAAPKATPKAAAPKATPKAAAPKATPKVAPKAAPKVTKAVAKKAVPAAKPLAPAKAPIAKSLPAPAPAAPTPVAAVAAAKRGRKPKRKAVRVPQPAAPAPVAEYRPALHGGALREEIARVEARLNYLKTLEKAEATYLAALRKK